MDKVEHLIQMVNRYGWSDRPFSRRTYHGRKSTGASDNINDPFYSSVPLNHVSMSVSRHVHYEDPEAEAAKWNSTYVTFIIYICAL